MPLAAYSYPHPAHSSAGSGLNYLHPAPPVLADGIFCPPAPYPCTYPPYYAHPAPPSCYPNYPDPRLQACLHHSGALPPSVPPAQYPHLHYCPGAPSWSFPADGVPSSPVGATGNDYGQDARAAHCRSPQLLYPQAFAMPPTRRSLAPEEHAASNGGDVDAAGQGSVPSLFPPPVHDKSQGAKPSNSFDSPLQWRGFPVTWKGGAPFALVPLSTIDGEQNLFMPKKYPMQFNPPEQLQEDVKADLDWPLLSRTALPIMWKQGSNPPAIHENEIVKVKPNAKDYLDDQVSCSKPSPMVWDVRSPSVVVPVKEGHGLIPADKEMGQGSECPVSGLITAPICAEEKESRVLEKQKVSTTEGPIKVIPVVQLPSNVSPVNEKEANKGVVDSTNGAGGVHHANAKLQAVKQVEKETAKAQQDSKGTCKNPSVRRKSFPAIKLVPASDAKGCKSSKKNAASQKKLAGQEIEGETANPMNAFKDEPLHGMDKCPDVKLLASVGVDGKASYEAVSPNVIGQKSTHIRHTPVSTVGAADSLFDEKRREALNASESLKIMGAVDRLFDEKRHEALDASESEKPHVKITGAADSLFDVKRYEAPISSESEKPHVNIMSQESAAKRIQAVYKGYSIRRSQPLTHLKIIKDIQANMPGIMKQLDSKAESMDPMERRRLSEHVMALLLKLDTVQGRLPYVREQRKVVAKDLNRVLEILDSIEQENFTPPSERVSTPEVIPDGEIASSTEEGTFTPEVIPVGEIASSLEATEESEMMVSDEVANSPTRVGGISSISGIGKVEGEGVALSDCEIASSRGGIFAPEILSVGEIASPWEAAKELEMIDEEVANLTTRVGGISSITGIGKVEGAALSESNEPLAGPSDNSRQEKMGAGVEAGESDSSPAFSEEGSMDEDNEVGNERHVVCANMREKRMQPEENREKEGVKKEDGIKGFVLTSSPDVGEIKEEIRFDNEFVAVNADGSLPLSADDVREQKIQEQAATSPPTEEIAGEEKVVEDTELDKGESMFALESMHIEQSQQLDNIFGERAEGTSELIEEEVEEGAVVPSSSITRIEEDGAVVPSSLIKGIEEEAEEHAVVESSSTKLLEEEKVQECELEGAHVSTYLIPSQHLDNRNGEELHKMVEVVSLLPDVVAQDVSEQALPSLAKEHAGGIADDGLVNTKITPESLVGESSVEPLASDNSVMEMDVAVEREDVPVQDNLQDMSHEESDANDVSCRDELNDPLAKENKLTDAQQAEEEEENFSSDAAHGKIMEVMARQSICESVNGTDSPGDVNTDQPFVADGFEMGDGEAVKIENVSIDSAEPFLKQQVALSKEDSLEESTAVCDCGLQQNVLLEEAAPYTPHLNTIDESEKPLSANAMEADIRKHCVEDLAIESKSLLAIVEKLTEWNQQQSNMILQLNERMDRLEQSRKAKHSINSRKGSRSRRRKI